MADHGSHMDYDESSDSQRPFWRAPLFVAWIGFLSFVVLLTIGLWMFGNPNGARQIVLVSLEKAAGADQADGSTGDKGSDKTNAPAADSAKILHDGNADEGTHVIEGPTPTSEVADADISDKVVIDETTGALPAVPDPDLVTQGKYGPLPQIGADGKRPAVAYARPFSDPKGRPQIALMIGGMGLSKTATELAIRELPPEVTLSFAPYPEELQRHVNLARAGGHEIMLQLPMEPFDYPQNDPGHHTLLTSQPVRKNLDDLDWLLSRVTGYAGVSNYLGAKFTTSKESLQPVIETVEKYGLFFVDDGSSQRSVVADVVRDREIGYALADRTIDARPSRTGIELKLLELEEIARANGSAVGVGALPYPVTINTVRDWAKTLEEKGLVLVPVSAIINK